MVFKISQEGFIRVQKQRLHEKSPCLDALVALQFFVIVANQVTSTGRAVPWCAPVAALATLLHILPCFWLVGVKAGVKVRVLKEALLCIY